MVANAPISCDVTAEYRVRKEKNLLFLLKQVIVLPPENDVDEITANDNCTDIFLLAVAKMLFNKNSSEDFFMAPSIR